MKCLKCGDELTEEAIRINGFTESHHPSAEALDIQLECPSCESTMSYFIKKEDWVLDEL